MKLTLIKLFIGLVLFGTLVALTVLAVPDCGRLLDLCYGGLIGLGIMHLGAAPATDSVPGKEGGFASLRMLLVLALFGTGAMLTGCAGVQQAVQAYGSVAVTGAKAANDTAIEAYKVALCATPISAVQRHPELVPAIKSLCLAPTDTATAALLDPVPK